VPSPALRGAGQCSCHANKFPNRRIHESKVYAAWENLEKAGPWQIGRRAARMCCGQHG
jgi:hypothetical protein